MFWFDKKNIVGSIYGRTKRQQDYETTAGSSHFDLTDYNDKEAIALQNCFNFFSHGVTLNNY